MKPRPRLSIVIEVTTGEISGECDARRHLLEWIEEATRATNRNHEILMVGPRPVHGLSELGPDSALRFLEVPGGGYYALKNNGANAAIGEIVFFTDLDCRPGPGALTSLLRSFEDPSVISVAGRSFYDGSGLLTRINTAHSFGDVHRGSQHIGHDSIVNSHNVALRREALPRDPFGPFDGRVGGDRYLTDRLRRAGDRVLLVDGVVVYHEDHTYNIRATLERHLRDCFAPFAYGTEHQRFSTRLTLETALIRQLVRRLRRVIRSGSRLGIRPWHYAIVLLLNAIYWAFDLIAVAVVLLIPPLRRRWLRFELGTPGR